MKKNQLLEIIKEELDVFKILQEFSHKAHGKRKKEWTSQPSSSNKTYTTVLWEDGVMSCNCQGWIYAKQGIRYCKHIKQHGGKPYETGNRSKYMK